MSLLSDVYVITQYKTQETEVIPMCACFILESSLLNLKYGMSDNGSLRITYI